MKLWLSLGLGCVGLAAAVPMTLSFSNKWNAVVNPTTETLTHITAAPGNQYYAVGSCGFDFSVRRYDAYGNIWAEKKVDQPSGGAELPTDIATDPSGNLYVLYRTDRLGSIQTRIAKLNSSLGVLWDTDFGLTASISETFVVDANGVYVAYIDTTSTKVRKLNPTTGTLLFTVDLGSGVALVDSADAQSNVVFVGDNGNQPRMYFINKTTGANSLVAPSSLNFANDVGNQYDRVVTSGFQVFAVGRGSEVGTMKSFHTRALVDGSGVAHTIKDTKSNRAIAASGSSVFWTRQDGADAEITRHNISTGGQTGLYPLSGYTAERSLAVSQDGTQIGVPLDNQDGHLMALLPFDIDGVNWIDGVENERMLAVMPGSQPKNFATIGYVSAEAGRREARMRMTGYNTPNWSQTVRTSAFPGLTPIDSAEDATGARYILLQSQLGFVPSLQTVLLKINASGVAQWSRVLNLGSLPVNVGRRVKVCPDGGIVVVGHNTDGSLAAQTQAAITKLNANGATLWTVNHRHGDDKNTRPYDAVIGADNSIYLFGDTLFVDNTNDAWVAKFSSTGQHQWSRVYDGGSTIDRALQGALLPNGSVASLVEQGNLVLVRVFSAAGVLQWTQGLPDSGGATAQNVSMSQEPGGNLAIAVHYYRASPSRSVIGVRRLNGVTKSIVMQSTLGAPVQPDFGVSATPSGHVAVWMEAASGFKITQVNSTTGAVLFNTTFAANRVQNLTSDRKNNLYALIEEQPNPANPTNSAVLRFTAAGAQTHKRTFAGAASHVRIGVGDAVWAHGSRLVKDRGAEASFTKWTQNLGP